MSYHIEGEIKKIMEAQTFPSGFTKQEFVITTKDQYPQEIKLELVKDKTALLSKFQVGSNVSVDFDIRGNEFKDKYYVNLVAWRIASLGTPDNYGQPAAPSAEMPDENMPF